MHRNSIQRKLQERFGDPIGSYAGNPPVGVRSETDDVVCPDCGMIPIAGQCGCSAENDVCPSCGMMPIQNKCGCKNSINEYGECAGGCTSGSCKCTSSPAKESQEKTCECGGSMNEDGVCECGSTHLEEGRKKKRKGPSKSTAKKILKGTKTFAQKMKKVSGWADNPAAGAAWMMHKATGKWPSQK
jgi:hypothetical protein